MSEPVLKVGFTVGLYTNGDLLFKFHGDEPTLIEIRGLLAFATDYCSYALKNQAPSIANDTLQEIKSIKEQLVRLESNLLCDSNKV